MSRDKHQTEARKGRGAGNGYGDKWHGSVLWDNLKNEDVSEEQKERDLRCKAILEEASNEDGKIDFFKVQMLSNPKMCPERAKKRAMYGMRY